MLPTLMDWHYGNERLMEEWAFQHAKDHEEIRQAIQAQGYANLVLYQLWPMDWKDWDSWAIRHQSAHNEENATLGLTDFDLTQVNFKDQKDMALWNFTHYQQHVAARSFLKI